MPVVSPPLPYTIAGDPSTRAALIDRLSILLAGGAGELTPARATLLPNLDALVSSRLGSIKSIQLIALSGPVSGTNTVTITSVNTAKAFALLNGMGSSAGMMIGCSGLTSATSVQLNYNNATPLVTLVVLEFN